MTWTLFYLSNPDGLTGYFYFCTVLFFLCTFLCTVVQGKNKVLVIVQKNGRMVALVSRLFNNVFQLGMLYGVE